jgi:inorganic pyrophosphatase
MNLLHAINAGEKAPEEVNVVVENCKGSSNKIEYDRENNVFKLDRVLYSAVYWPFEYGFIPQTWSEDEDPLDICVLITHPTFPGCVIKARPIGVIKLEDEHGLDSKILAVATEDPVYSYDHVCTGIRDVPSHILREIREFFETYKRLEPGKWVKVKGWGDAKEAKELIVKAMKAYEKKFKKKKTQKRKKRSKR